MPGDEFRKKLKGQQYRQSARVLSAQLDAAADAKAARGPTFDAEASADNWRQTGIVKVLNSSGSDVSRFGVLGLNAPIILNTDNLTEFQEKPTFVGGTPQASNAGKFAVMIEPVPSGQIGRGVVSGVTVAKVRVTKASAAFQFADVLPNDATQLQLQNTGSARVLWIDPAVTSGTADAVVRIDDGGAASATGGGTTLNVVTNVCGTTIEYTPITVPAGSVVGTPFCLTSPTNCCGAGVIPTTCCPGATPPTTLCAAFNNDSGALPFAGLQVTMTYNPAGGNWTGCAPISCSGSPTTDTVRVDLICDTSTLSSTVPTYRVTITLGTKLSGCGGTSLGYCIGATAIAPDLVCSPFSASWTVANGNPITFTGGGGCSFPTVCGIAAGAQVDLTITAGGCTHGVIGPVPSGTGLGSGSSGCVPTAVPLSTPPVTVPAGDLLIVNVGMILTGSAASVSWGGVSLTEAQAATQANPVNYRVGVWYVKNTGLTRSAAITITPPAAAIILWSALYVASLSNGTPDQGANAHGIGNTPDTGTTAALAGNDFCQADFISVDLPPSSWGGGFASEGMDVTCFWAPHFYTLSAGFKIVQPPGGTADASLTSGSPTSWAGALEAFD